MSSLVYKVFPALMNTGTAVRAFHNVSLSAAP